MKLAGHLSRVHPQRELQREAQLLVADRAAVAGLPQHRVLQLQPVHTQTPGTGNTRGRRTAVRAAAKRSRPSLSRQPYLFTSRAMKNTAAAISSFIAP
ncbi:hypothetical protein EYF80_044721 [Liparis tanakae]|uniref:Uncharacterized protein n=1 Tax=Liparis tanakae TaxID=230148 RepID=A0A4Z2FV40_9TELE|nr:hypothetical protein EYF80_044721 [Liparis tanakae]